MDKSSHDFRMRIMPYAVTLMKLAVLTRINGVSLVPMEYALNTGDKFLIATYPLILSGTDPVICELIFKNFLENETDEFEKIKCKMQMDAVLTMQSSADIHTVCMAICSNFGIDFKDEFIKYIKENEESYEKILPSFDFSNFDLRKMAERMKNGDPRNPFHNKF